MKKVYRILIIVAVSILGLGVLALLAYLIWRKIHKKKIAKLSEKLESLEKGLRQEYDNMLMLLQKEKDLRQEYNNILMLSQKEKDLRQENNKRSENKSIVEEKFNGTPLYYINLDRDTNRRKYMEDQFNLYDIKNVKRIQGIDGEQISNTAEGKIKSGGKYIKFSNNYTNNNKGELGCVLSHIVAIKTAYDNKDDIALIIEDDVSLALVPFWQIYLKEISQSAPSNWKIINLCGLKGECYKKSDKEFLSFPKYTCWGTQAYLINRSGMETILKGMSHDMIILDKYDKVNHKAIAADLFIYQRAKDSYTYVKHALFYPYNVSFISNITENGMAHKRFLKKAINSIQRYMPIIKIDRQTSKRDSIPKIIHQTWKTADLPENFAKWSETWKKYHPQWKYIFWSDEDLESFVKTRYPSFYPTYQAFDKHIKRVDSVRYLILHYYGGLYVDMDFECLRNLDPLLEEKQIVLGRMGYDAIYAHSLPNALMASVKGHPFWMDVIRMISERKNESQVEYVTGPIVLLDTYLKYPYRDITVYSTEYFYLINWNNSSSWKKYENLWEKDPDEFRRKYPNTYALTYWTHTWE
jgi:mannosyltransferase OCH1-like enzyme